MSTAPDDDPPPPLILRRRHASGLYGVVWEGRQTKLGRTVAVKIIGPEWTEAGTLPPMLGP